MHGKEVTWLIRPTDLKIGCFKPALILQVGELWL